MEQLQFIIMGAGAWGTAMAIHLSKLGHKVVLCPRNTEKAQKMQEARENVFHLPGIPFPDNLQVDSHFEIYLNHCDVIFIACPTQGLVEVCERLKPYQKTLKRIISLVKGLERHSLKTPSDWFFEHLPQVECLCLSGPTYANDFALGKRSAMVLASKQPVVHLQKAMSNDFVRIYNSSDLRGVELGSCLKNIYALGAGILEGLQLGDNAKAAYLTRALHEMAHLGIRLGGQKETFYGLSGLGDLFATAQGSWSRNRCFGEKFACGQPIEELLQNHVVEGYWSIQCFFDLAQKISADAPILNALHRALYEHYPLKLAVKDLMTRALKSEV